MAELIKPQAAFYERHDWRGMRTLARLIDDARDAGLLVVLDAKRGDVGSTNFASPSQRHTTPREAPRA
jgi:orotidine-5'-phosphate decarboxylase